MFIKMISTLVVFAGVIALGSSAINTTAPAVLSPRFTNAIILSQDDIDNNRYASGSLVVFENGLGWGLGVLVSTCTFIVKITTLGNPKAGTYMYLQDDDTYKTDSVAKIISTRNSNYKYAQFTPGTLPSPSTPAFVPGPLETAPSQGTGCYVLGFGDTYTPQKLPAIVISPYDCFTAWAGDTAVQTELENNPSKYFCAYPTSDRYFTTTNFSLHFQSEDLPGPTFCNSGSDFPVQLQVTGLLQCTWIGFGIGKPVFAGFVKYFKEGTGKPPVVIEYIGGALYG